MANGGLRGLLETKGPMGIHMLTIWLIGMPLAYGLGFAAEGGLEGMAWAFNVANSVGACLLATRLAYKSEQLIHSATDSYRTCKNWLWSSCSNFFNRNSGSDNVEIELVDNSLQQAPTSL